MTERTKPSAFGNGCILHDIIAVDYWKNFENVRPRLFFLTHLHADHTDGLNSSWSRGPVFTSPVNVRLAKHFIEGPLKFLVPLELNKPHELPLSQAKDSPTITVTLINANHVPGAVMFVFSGFFGNTLYTGDFRYNPKMFDHDIMHNIDTVYLDNTFFFREYNFPSRTKVINRLITFLKSLPPDLRIYIGLRRLGKESALVSIGQALNEWICVTQERFNIFATMGLPEVFTTNPNECRIFAVNQAVLSKKFLNDRNSEKPSIGIMLSALYYNWPGGPYSASHAYGLHVFELSDHSSHPELMEFIKKLRPKKVLPIVTGKEGNGFLKDRQNFVVERVDMSSLQPYLSTEPLLEYLVPDFNEPALACTAMSSRKRPKLTKESLRRPYKGPKGPVYESSVCNTTNSSNSSNERRSLESSSVPSPPKSLHIDVDNVATLPKVGNGVLLNSTNLGGNSSESRTKNNFVTLNETVETTGSCDSGAGSDISTTSLEDNVFESDSSKSFKNPVTETSLNTGENEFYTCQDMSEEEIQIAYLEPEREVTPVELVKDRLSRSLQQYRQNRNRDNLHELFLSLTFVRDVLDGVEAQILQDCSLFTSDRSQEE